MAKFLVRLISGGRLFQMSQPATENVLQQNWVAVRFTTAARVVDDQRRHTAVSLSWNVTMSIRYARQQRCISAASLNKSQNLTDSQCSRSNAGMMCAYWSRPSTNRAATFCTHCSGAWRCSNQCEWWPVIALVEPSHCDQCNYRAVGDDTSRRWQLSRYGWSWSVHCQRWLWGCVPHQSTGRANCRAAVNGVGPVSWQDYCGLQTRWSLSLMGLAEDEVKRRHLKDHWDTR